MPLAFIFLTIFPPFLAVQEERGPRKSMKPSSNFSQTTNEPKKASNGKDFTSPKSRDTLMPPFQLREGKLFRVTIR